VQRLQPHSGTVVNLVKRCECQEICSRTVRRSPPGGGGRDSVKVAQHEVLGLHARKVARPGGTIEMIESGHSIGLAGTNDTLSSLAGRFFVKKTDPPLKWWATFTQSLRDKSCGTRAGITVDHIWLRRPVSVGAERTLGGFVRPRRSRDRRSFSPNPISMQLSCLRKS
jgi:hypothetical protein